MGEAGDPVQVASFEVGILLNGTLIVHVLLYFMSYEQGAWPHIEEEGGGVAATQLKHFCLNTIVCTRSCCWQSKQILVITNGKVYSREKSS